MVALLARESGISHELFKPLGIGVRMSLELQVVRELPILNKLRAVVTCNTVERSRNGSWLDGEGKVLPNVEDAEVRGQTVLVNQSTAVLKVNFGGSAELKAMLDWHPARLWGREDGQGSVLERCSRGLG